MKISIDTTAGFCWGVVRTIRIVENELNTGNKLVSLGDIIHNPKEIQRLSEMGMNTVHHSDFEKIPRNMNVLIRAHGEPPSTYRKAREYGLRLIDATCPVVTKLQERIRRYYDDGFQIVIFGKKNHAEVIGLRGVCNDQCIVIQSLAEAIEKVDLKRNTVIFAQTTMDKPTFYAIKAYLEDCVHEVIFEMAGDVPIEFHAKDTICGQVAGREEKLREFAAQNDVVIFLAGKKSSNGQVLFQICKETNSNSHFIEEIEEIDSSWFEEMNSIGITGATSTPKWFMEKAKKYLEESLSENEQILEKRNPVTRKQQTYN